MYLCIDMCMCILHAIFRRTYMRTDVRLRVKVWSGRRSLPSDKKLVAGYMCIGLHRNKCRDADAEVAIAVTYVTRYRLR